MLLMYFTAPDNAGLLTDICQNRNIILKTMLGPIDLQRIVLHDLSNLDICQYIVIDLSAVQNTDDDIIKSIVAIQSMYTTRIIIFARGYRRGHPLLARIFAEGIYNICTAEHMADLMAELAACIDGPGRSYKDAVVYRADPQATPGGERVIIEQHTMRQSIAIALCGSMHRVGTTVHALQIARELINDGYTACYIQAHDGLIASILDIYEVEDKGACYRCAGVDIYLRCDLSVILPRTYDYLIYDYGVFGDLDLQRYMSHDAQIVCGGGKPWELTTLQPVMAALQDVPNVHYILSFVPDSEQPAIRRLMGRMAVHTQFATFAPDMMDTANASLHRLILRPWLRQDAHTRPKRRLGHKKS